MAFNRWWSRHSGIPFRALMGALSSHVPHRQYQGIGLLVADPRLEPSAERFFERTSAALSSVASVAPHAYAALRQDVTRIVLSSRATIPYQRFQLAVVVPPRVAFGADIPHYAAWLLHTSAYMRGEEEAQIRREEFLRSLESDQRVHVAAWLQDSFIAWEEI